MITEDIIRQRVHSVLASLFTEPKNADGFADADDLIQDLGMDSLDLVELTMGLEEEFVIVIPDPDQAMSDVRTIGDVISLVQKLLPPSDV